MRYTCALGLLFALAASGCVGGAKGPSATAENEAMATVAARLSNAPSGPRAEDDVRALRHAGPAGLDALIADAGPAPSADQKRRIDEVAQQRDAYASHLYWYTDLEDAKRASKASGKPILSLRLLGKLTDELSCANSRFFRTALYPNAKVSAALHDRFVLHWSMERPAPSITIDFHDGRKIERTVTGNSLHYVLDSEGRPIDAIPGLYSPDAFLRALADAESIAARISHASETDRATALRAYHRDALNVTREAWSGDLLAAGFAPRPLVIFNAPAGNAGNTQVTNVVPANLAMPVAMGKAMSERRLVQAVMPPVATTAEVRGALDAVPWAALAAPHRSQATIDEPSRAMIRAKHPMDWSDPNAPHPLADADLARMLDGFERLMAEDTEKNELSLHASIHTWLAAEPSIDFTALNTRVYDTLFLTPRSDPWLGLVPPATFTAIENDGVIPR